MFIVVSIAAVYGNTTSLLADSLDNFGDALTYAISLYVITKKANTKAKVALFKGYLILLAAVVVATQIIYKIFIPSTPVFEIMGIFSIVGIIANSLCLFLLWKHRKEDINMTSVWECSKNDIISNISVFIAAVAVWLTSSYWPDILVAIILVIVLIRSALHVISSATRELDKY